MVSNEWGVALMSVLVADDVGVVVSVLNTEHRNMWRGQWMQLSGVT